MKENSSSHSTDHAFPEVTHDRFPESQDPLRRSRLEEPLAFRHYNPDELVEGIPMKDQLRFSVAYWHTFRGSGSDPFGPGTMLRPWDAGDDSRGERRRRGSAWRSSSSSKLGAPFFCFHDRDVAPEGKTLAETNATWTRWSR